MSNKPHYRIVHDREYNLPWVVYMVIGDYAHPIEWFRTRQKAKDWVKNRQAVVQESPE